MTEPRRPFRDPAPTLGAAAARALLVLLVLLPLPCGGVGCKRQTPTPAAAQSETVDMRIGNQTFRLWVAATEQDRRYGLMKRQSMPADRGMIFVFGTDEPRVFHMENTLIPLDILYLDAGGKVVGVYRMEALARTPSGQWKQTPSYLPMRYAIELNAGMAAAAGVQVGDVLAIPEAAKTPKNLE